MPGKTINLRVGCEFAYDVSAPTPVTVQVRPRSDSSHQLVSETWSTTPSLPVDEYTDIYGNPVKRFVMPPGPLVLRYDAICAIPDEPDPDASTVAQPPVEELPPQAASRSAATRGRETREPKRNVFTAGPPSTRVIARSDCRHY